MNRIRGMGYELNDLSYLHETVPLNEVYTVTKQLCADTNLPEFRRMLNRFVREVVVTQGKLRLPVAVQRFMNVRIMLPTTPELFFPFHTGLLYGHGIASRSMWLPFVDVTADEDRSRSMQIIGIKKSRELIKYAIDNRLNMEEMTEVFGQGELADQGGAGQRLLLHPGKHPRLGPAEYAPARPASAWISASPKGSMATISAARSRPAISISIPDTEEEEEALAAQPPREERLRQRQAEHVLCRQQHVVDVRHTGASAALHAGGLLARRRTSSSTMSCSTLRT